MLIKPLIQPIPFTGLNNALPIQTAHDFKLTEKDKEMSQGTKIHRFNHIAQNIQLASQIREVKNVQQCFKRSVLAKNNQQNLKILADMRNSIET